MITALLKLLATITGWGFWERQRAADKADDPNNQYEKARQENSRIIAQGDERAANVKLDDRLNRLSRPKG